MHDTVGDVEKFVRAFKSASLNHITRQVQSVTQSMAQLGIGKGFAAKVDKFAAGAEAKKKVQEYSIARKAGNKEAAEKKRQAAIEHVTKHAENLGVKLTQSGDINW